VQRHLTIALTLLISGCSGAKTAGRSKRPRGKPGGAGEQVEQLAAGGSHTCALYSTGRVRCWGANNEGQLGDGTKRTRFNPRDVVGLDDAVHVDADGDATCAVHRSGSVSCWGEPVGAPYGRFGDEEVESLTAPARVPGIDDAVEVRVGVNHSCAIRRSGKLSCWGSGEGGELGDGKRSDSKTAVEAAIEDVVDVDVASRVTCAIKRGGEVWCWGSNHYGTLRRDSESLEACGENRRCQPRPARVPDVPKLRQIATNDSHVCGVTADENRHVMCWGAPYSCAFGVDIPYDKRDEVHRVPGVRDVQALVGSQCVLDEAGVLCWYQEHRDDSDYSYDEPERCGGDRIGLAKPTSVALGSGHGCAVFGGKDIQCWGTGRFGWLNVQGAADPLQPVAQAGVFEPNTPDVDPYKRLRARVPSTEPLAGFALAWGNASIYRAPKDGAVVGRLVDFADDERYDTATRQFVVRITKDHGRFVEVTNVPDHGRKDHCGADATGDISRYDLRFFLHEDDLVPVLPHQYADSHEDGSVVFLAAGTPVIPTALGNGVMVGGIWIPMYSEGKDLELSYSPDPLVDDEGVRPSWSPLQTSIESSLLGRGIRLGQLPEALREHWYVDADEQGTRLVLGDRCRRVEVVIDTDDPRRPVAQGGGAGGIGIGGLGRPKKPTEWIVAPGAPAYWPEGSQAGSLRHRWTTKTAPDEIGDRRCWQSSGDLRLCHDAASITVVPGDQPAE